MMIRWLIRILSVAVLAWIVGFFLFLNAIPPKAPGSHPNADAIVVLTGGRDRLDVGMRLLADGYADKLLVSGVGYGVQKKELFSLQPLSDPAKKSVKEKSAAVSLGYEAYSTATNARETRRWMRQNNLHSLLLVTASYHMSRSVMEFSALMPRMTIYPVPVIPADFKKATWWKDAHMRKLVLSEYHKFIASWCRIHLWDEAPT